MCGLAFLYDPGENCIESSARMTDALQCMLPRGPDAQEQCQNGRATIGHVRLSIVDLAGSHQPMHSPDGRYTIAFNGEIYNYQMLREQLIDRWQFLTKGDTEVLLAGLIIEGNEFVSRLEGMWGFVLWDNLQEIAVISRDRTGKKPLYYTEDNGRFACASELPALNVVWGKSWQEDLDTTADYFRYGYALPGSTFYKKVYELKPAMIATWSPPEGFAVETYWTPRVEVFRGSYSQAQERLREAMDNSIKRRLVSDVEVGSFLSGGIDSSIVSALAAREHGKDKLKTFTIGFNEKEYDERPYARKVAEYIGVDHYEKVLHACEPDTLKRLLLERVGQPFSDSSILPTAEVSGLAAGHVKVALSGDGADELFCGYPRYKARAILNVYRWAPAPVRKMMRKWVSLLPEKGVHSSRGMLKKLHLFMDVMDRRDAEDPYIAAVFFSDTVFEQLFPSLKQKSHNFIQPWVCDTSLPDIKKMMLADSFVYLPQDIHTKVDRASMAHSLETRAPFMDTAVVELALSLPLQWSFSWRKNKKILVDTFTDLLPADIWTRKKQGFAVPIAAWMRGELGDELEGLIHELRGTVPFDEEKVLVLLNSHRNHQRDFGYRLWLVYVYLVWRNESTMLESV